MDYACLWADGIRVSIRLEEHNLWFRKTANVLAALPKSAQPGAKKALAEKMVP